MSGITSIPIIGGMFDDTDDQAMAELRRNRALYEGIELPEHVWEDYRPELYRNEAANYELIQEDPGLRSMQMDVLSRMAGLAESGLSDVDAAGFQAARNMGDQMARGGTEAAIQNAQNRGVAGSGMEFALREIANQSGAQRAQEAGLNQAAESARQRALYQQAFGNALGSVRGQDLSANSANTDIINQFNMANTQNRNATNNANVDQKNQAQQTNQRGRIDTKQQNFNNEMSRAGGISGANSQVADAYAAQNAANTADRNMWTQIAAQGAMAGMGGGGAAAGAAVAKKKPMAGQGYFDPSNVA